jgi:hypothetical protein
MKPAIAFLFVACACSAASGCAGDETETGACPEAKVPSALSEAGPVEIRWSLTPGCIETSYDSAFRHLRTEIELAFEEWSSTGCDSLCLSPPIEKELEDRPMRVIHVMTPFLTEAHFRITVTHRTFDGDIRNALIELRPDLAPPVFQRLLLALIGEGLGFAPPTRDVPSVLNSAFSDLTALTRADVAAFCRKYGGCGSM